MTNANSSTYKQTTMQKLLGRNYKWWYVMVFNYKSASASLFSDLFYYLNHLITTIVAIIIWNINSNGDTTILPYLIFGNMLFSLTLLNNNWRLSGDISSGKLSSKLLLPSNLPNYYLFNSLAYALRQSVIILFYIPVIIYLNNKLKFDTNTIFLTALFIPIVLYLKFTYNQILGSVTFWHANSYGIIEFAETVLTILSGSLIPLFFFPTLFQFTPFAFMIHHPMQIYLGKYDTNQTLMVFAGGITWCVVLYFLAKWVFKMGLKKNEAVGL